LIGVVLILDNVTFLPNFIPWWIWTWQFLLITIGVFSLLTTDKTGPGIILIGIGSIFLLSDILPDYWPGFFGIFDNNSNLLWYLIIILVGVSLIFRKKGVPDGDWSHRRRGRRHFGSTGDDEPQVFSGDGNDIDFLDEVAIFGGGKKIITTENFKGGRVTTIFGGSEIIFAKSHLAPGICEIEVFAMFGGWTLVVPQHWQVKIDVVSVFGGISDKRILSSETMKDNTSQLVIKGFVMFGGGEIKSF
jgi:hypothetical protein